MTMTGRVGRAAAAAAVAITLVAGVGSLQGATATTTSPADAAVAAMQRVLGSPSYLAAERAVLAGQPVPADAKRALEAQVTDLVASPAFAAAARELGAATVATGDRGVPEFMYHLNQGNQRMLAAVGVFTALVVPQTLNCAIGNPGCVEFWLLVGVNLSSAAVISGAFEYEQAVLSLA